MAGELDALSTPEAKSLVAEGDEQLVERIERMLALALQLRDVQARGGED
jgi:hypothetical protein